MTENKVALVTGSSRGIGRGIALALSENNWEVAIHYQNNKQAAEEVVTLIENKALKSTSIQANLDSMESIRKLVDATLQYFGHIDLLVNNAGMTPRERVDMLKVSEVSYDEIMSVNLKGPFFLTQQVANHMIQGIQTDVVHKAKIINISSISAFTSGTRIAEYCISKAGLSMTTRLWADRLSEYGIGVYELRPGIIQTDLTTGVKEKYDHLIHDLGLLPIPRWGQPDDIGKAVVAIAEDYLPYSTGEVINIDGGFHLRRL
jgi:3-oxoacyl-[acyl-carrier protein] reductase